jgi:pimeloyl-ACP methyl ester carboxylesterase
MAFVTLEGAQEGVLVDIAGVQTQIREAGSGGTPLVLLHGVLSDGTSWSDVAGPLSRDRRLVIPDLPLHGRSRTSPDFQPGPEGMVAWLEALLDELGIVEADLCGLSMGGAVATHFAILRPDRLRRLVLVDAANIVYLDEDYRLFIAEMRENLEAARGVDVATSRDRWTDDMGLEGAKSAAGNLCTDPIVMSVLEYLEARGIPFDQMTQGLDLLEPLGEEDLATISAPTLAVWGSDDPFFSAQEAVEKLEGGIADCRIEVMEGVGHNPVAERPREFIQLVKGFLG